MSPEFRPWFERLPERFAQEREEMAKLEFAVNDEVLRAERRVEFQGSSAVDPTRPLVIRYPDAFPSMPPRAFSMAPGNLLLRHHRPGTWEICIFGPEQVRWSASKSGTAAIDEAEKVIRQFTSEADPDPYDGVPEPVTTSYPYLPRSAFVIPPPISTQVAPGSARMIGSFRVRFQRHIESNIPIRGVVLAVETGGATASASMPFNAWYQRGQEQKGNLILLPAPPPFASSPEEFRRWLAGERIVPAPWLAFAFPEQSGTASKRRVSWLLANFSSDHKAYLLRAFPIRRDERRARIPGTEGLASQRVVVIGCGALGSKISASIAATGVETFGLVDIDFFEPDNSVRHELGAEPDTIGVPKVVGLSKRLVSLNPLAHGNIEVLTLQIGGINSWEEEEKLFRLMASANLVVEATGVHGVSRYINDACHDLGIPSLHVSVTNGAWGGEIVRVIPGETPCWLCWMAQYEKDRPSSAPGPEHGVFAPGCDQPTFTGTSYEVGIVANLAAWAAVDTLLRQNPDRRIIRGDYIRWTARRDDGTPDMKVEVLSIKPRSDCSLYCKSI